MNPDNQTGLLLDNISVGICIIDKDFKILFWNEFMESYTGYSKSEVQNNYLFDFFPSFKINIYYDRVNNIFNGWPPVILSSRLHNPFFTHHTKKEIIRFQEITITPFNDQKNEINQAIITVTDVTDLTIKHDEQRNLYNKAQEELRMRTEMQEKLAESEQLLRELNSTKDKLFSIIAHDLISPFTSIMGLSQILSQNVIEKDYDGIVEFSKEIISATKKTYDLLLNLLEWSRFQTGRISFHPSDVDFYGIIKDNVALHKSSAEQKGIVIECELLSGIKIFADFNMLNTIVRNLISNAIKYTFKGGKIKISATQNENDIEFSISDTGIGISEKDIERIFNLESKISTTGTANEIGSGLGLVLCKEFIDIHNGKINVSSLIGKGSNFRVILPQKMM
jgi:PAS domain S-box-containing protein